MSDTKVLTPEQIAELRAALAVLPMLSMLGGEGWPDTGAGVDWPLAPQSSDVPLPKGERPTIIAATPEIQRAVWMLRNAAPALLDAAERCAKLEAALRQIADGDAGHQGSFDWPEFYESIRKHASEALVGGG